MFEGSKIHDVKILGRIMVFPSFVYDDAVVDGGGEELFIEFLWVLHT